MIWRSSTDDVNGDNSERPYTRHGGSQGGSDTFNSDISALAEEMRPLPPTLSAIDRESAECTV